MTDSFICFAVSRSRGHPLRPHPHRPVPASIRPQEIRHSHDIAHPVFIPPRLRSVETVSTLTVIARLTSPLRERELSARGDERNHALDTGDVHLRPLADRAILQREHVHVGVRVVHVLDTIDQRAAGQAKLVLPRQGIRVHDSRRDAEGESDGGHRVCVQVRPRISRKSIMWAYRDGDVEVSVPDFSVGGTVELARLGGPAWDAEREREREPEPDRSRRSLACDGNSHVAGPGHICGLADRNVRAGNGDFAGDVEVDGDCEVRLLRGRGGSVGGAVGSHAGAVDQRPQRAKQLRDVGRTASDTKPFTPFLGLVAHGAQHVLVVEGVALGVDGAEERIVQTHLHDVGVLGPELGIPQMHQPVTPVDERKGGARLGIAALRLEIRQGVSVAEPFPLRDGADTPCYVEFRVDEVAPQARKGRLDLANCWVLVANQTHQVRRAGEIVHGTDGVASQLGLFGEWAVGLLVCVVARLMVPGLVLAAHVLVGVCPAGAGLVVKVDLGVALGDVVILAVILVVSAALEDEIPRKFQWQGIVRHFVKAQQGELNLLVTWVSLFFG
ncbi:hypothetical protein CLCR_04766 [Cladophialophora carrionii]|uniref:Uncharacterized protein n=1 Tax=Cladophialophora carrionii TaxID=86049 RepID=A0A1C1CLI4_9EURO|nr:hypothetical protein CLCR_04766 [Cladophialophora carrionii]